jgi:serine/threonine protein kinase
MDHESRAKLEKLLVSLLGEADMRRIVCLLPGGEHMHAELPGAGASLTALVHQAVSVLEQHGRLDGAFFEALVAERPARRDEIRALAARMLEITAVTRLIPAIRAPAQKPTKLSAPAADPLAQALDDALARKQRLEAAGLPVAEVLDEIRKLKRELRRGGMLRPGDVLGHRYLLAEKIGQGGFGTVWRARDRRTGEDVAIKVLHPNLAGADERRQRFFRGARIMAEIAHPAVVAVRQLEDEDDGFHYFVMDFLAGGNLHDAVLERRVRREQIQALILQIGAALAAAHKRGIVHRDIKPSNILLDDERRPYLTDFDLVTAPDTTGGTRTGALGTFIYAPPEMLERPQEANARADVYGLGMTMAFMLHGRLLPHISVRDASRFVRSLACPAPFHPVLTRAIAWEPKHRFADAEEFCQALHEATREPDASESKFETLKSDTSRPKLPPGVSTLRELLEAIRSGWLFDCPILVNVALTAEKKSGSTLSATLATKSVDWVEFYGREYASGEVLLLGFQMPAVNSLTIGRSRECDIRICNDSVSKLHASVLFNRSSHEYHVVDEGSRNGTTINGDLLTPQVPTAIWSGAYVSFGDTVFVFIDPETLRKLVLLRRPPF